MFPRVEEAIPAAFCFAVGATVHQGVKLVKYLMREKSIEAVTRETLKSFDECDTGVEASLEMLSSVAKMAPRIRKRARQIGANSLALNAYLKFGKRPKSPANVIITRKYVSDLLVDNKDLRLRDKVELMDMAVFLSFLPSETSLLCNEMERTKSYAGRFVPAFLRD